MDSSEILERLKAIRTITDTIGGDQHLYLIQGDKVVWVFGKIVVVHMNGLKCVVGQTHEKLRCTIPFEEIAQLVVDVPLIYSSRQAAEDALKLYKECLKPLLQEDPACNTRPVKTTDPRRLMRGQYENVAIFITKKTTWVLADFLAIKDYESLSFDDCRTRVLDAIHDKIGRQEPRHKARSFYYEVLGRATAAHRSSSGPGRSFWEEVKENVDSLGDNAAGEEAEVVEKPVVFVEHNRLEELVRHVTFENGLFVRTYNWIFASHISKSTWMLATLEKDAAWHDVVEKASYRRLAEVSDVWDAIKADMHERGFEVVRFVGAEAAYWTLRPVPVVVKEVEDIAEGVMNVVFTLGDFCMQFSWAPRKENDGTYWRLGQHPGPTKITLQNLINQAGIKHSSEAGVHAAIAVMMEKYGFTCSRSQDGWWKVMKA